MDAHCVHWRLYNSVTVLFNYHLCSKARSLTINLLHKPQIAQQCSSTSELRFCRRVRSLNTYVQQKCRLYSSVTILQNCDSFSSRVRLHFALYCNLYGAGSLRTVSTNHLLEVQFSAVATRLRYYAAWTSASISDFTNDTMKCSTKTDSFSFWSVFKNITRQNLFPFVYYHCSVPHWIIVKRSLTLWEAHDIL